MDLPAFGAMTEPEYNKHVADNNEDVCLMDAKLIQIGPGASSVEFCDLYSKAKVLVHVKKYGGSSVLSHLFQQGVVSAQAFRTDSDFRTKVNEKLEDAFKFDPSETPTSADHEICYAIMSNKPGPLRVPFFSMVVCNNAHRRLQAYGFKVTKKKISQA